MLLIGGMACTSKSERLFQLALDQEKQEKYFPAVTLYQKAYQPTALQSDLNFRIAERVSELYLNQLRNPEQALYWLNQIKINTSNSAALVQAQTKIIRVALDFLNDYPMAAREARKLLSYELNINEKCAVVYDLSFALYQLRQLEEANQEIKICLGNIPIDRHLSFRLLTLEVDILLALDRAAQALDRLAFLKNNFKELDHDSKLDLTESMILEEQGNFEGARQVIQRLIQNQNYSDIPFLKLRLEKLKARESQQAGARLTRRRKAL